MLNKVTRLTKENSKYILIIFIILLVFLVIFLYGRFVRVNHDISVVSEIEGYSVEIADQEGLRGYVEQMGFWEKNANMNKIVIHLTDQPQKKIVEYDDLNNTPDNPRFSLDYNPDGDTIHLYVQIGNSFYESGEEDAHFTNNVGYGLFVIAEAYDTTGRGTPVYEQHRTFIKNYFKNDYVELFNIEGS